MKKLLALLLVLVMVLSLAACAAKTEPAAPAEDAAPKQMNALDSTLKAAAAFLAYLQGAEASAEFEKVLFTPLSK